MTSLYAVLGGTFDPIHYGHTTTSEILAEKINLKKIILLPTYNSLCHNQSIISVQHKVKMIKLAIKNKPLFKINYLEIKKKYLIL
ncbi:MAG: adenylyltransferase/cytidyltransferase family protein [Buchnera aphidicola (Melaphis rhois)]